MRRGKTPVAGARVAALSACAAGVVFGLGAMGTLATPSQPSAPVLAPTQGPSPGTGKPELSYRLNNAVPALVPQERANPAAVADKFSARVRSLDQRATLRAYDGAPPVIPHATADMNIQTCRACHAQGLVAGGLVARMASHTYLPNCTQCHVEGEGPFLDGAGPMPQSTFVGLRSSGYGGTRAWAGAPPVMPHTTFMRTNCTSCHGEHGYDGWRPDHLSRSNCVQCHAPAAQFEQLAPTFGIPDLPDGVSRLINDLAPPGGA